MEYAEYNTIEDLLFNRSFRNWVLHRKPVDDPFWENWLANNQDKTRMINDAKAILYALQINLAEPSESDINTEIEKVLKRVKDYYSTTLLGDEAAYKRKPFLRLATKHKFIFVLGIILLVTIPLVFFVQKRKFSKPEKTLPFTASETRTHFTEDINNTDSVQVVILPDCSKVLLQQKSKLRYDPRFSDVNREVYLAGEAFFEVKKDASKPFLVFTNSIITKVLGTSFSVKAFDSDNTAMVTVKTGKVCVFNTDNFDEKYATGKELKGILVTPNQQIVYTPGNKDFTKSITGEPSMITQTPNAAFRFDGTPVSKVFKTMEAAYSIPIVYDEETISSCSLSANMGDEPFYEKLSMICKAINASYEIIDGSIIITSKGCR